VIQRKYPGGELVEQVGHAGVAEPEDAADRVGLRGDRVVQRHQRGVDVVGAVIQRDAQIITQTAAGAQPIPVRGGFDGAAFAVEVDAQRGAVAADRGAGGGQAR
jgi:hypothetical protein